MGLLRDYEPSDGPFSSSNYHGQCRGAEKISQFELGAKGRGSEIKHGHETGDANTTLIIIMGHK